MLRNGGQNDKKRLISSMMSIIVLVMVVSVSAFAEDKRDTDSFDFEKIVYEWKYATNYTSMIKKVNTSAGVVNTKKTTGNNGLVAPAYNFNAELAMPAPNDITTKVRLGHYWGCAPHSRQAIPYSDTSASYAKGRKVQLGLSLRSEGLTAHIRGSWSPDETD